MELNIVRNGNLLTQENHIKGPEAPNRFPELKTDSLLSESQGYPMSSSYVGMVQKAAKGLIPVYVSLLAIFADITYTNGEYPKNLFASFMFNRRMYDVVINTGPFGHGVMTKLIRQWFMFNNEVNSCMRIDNVPSLHENYNGEKTVIFRNLIVEFTFYTKTGNELFMFYSITNAVTKGLITSSEDNSWNANIVRCQELQHLLESTIIPYNWEYEMFYESDINDL